MAGKTGIPIVIDSRQFSALTRGIRASGPAGAAAVRRALRDSAEIVKTAAAQNASYSSRIPGSLRARATATNFKVSAGGDAAPDAAPIENKGRGFVRHPVFGDRENWTEKNSHPAFLAPALEAHTEEIVELLTDRLTAAVDEAIGSALP
jgi:hypothetical protein